MSSYKTVAKASTDVLRHILTEQLAQYMYDSPWTLDDYKAYSELRTEVWRVLNEVRNDLEQYAKQLKLHIQKAQRVSSSHGNYMLRMYEAARRENNERLAGIYDMIRCAKDPLIPDSWHIGWHVSLHVDPTRYRFFEKDLLTYLVLKQMLMLKKQQKKETVE